MLNKDKLIYLGFIGKVHGIQGSVCVKSLTASPEDIVKMPLQDKSGKAFKLRLISSKPEFLICSVEGVKDRNSAELLKGTKLYTIRSAMPEPAEEEYYIEDIIGLVVQDSDGKKLGKLLAMHNFGAGDIVEIEYVDGRSEMYPFTEAFFPTVTKEHVVFVTSFYSSGDV